MCSYEKSISKKKQLARKFCKQSAEREELIDQIEVCEGLCCPLSENQIMELAQLSLAQMQRAIRNHKFAY